MCPRPGRPHPALVLFITCALGRADAATFTVNSTTDAVDAAPGNGVALTAGGVTTLRAAIQEANALAGPDTIVLPANTYVLNRASGDDTATNGDLDITQSLVVLGAGARTTIIDGNALDRVFDVRGGTVSMSGLRVTNGNAAGSDGGGIRVVAGTLALTDAAVTQSAGKNGGGIFNDATLTLLRVTLSGNRATAGTGGGLASGGASPRNYLTNVTLSGNTSTGDGGGGEADHAELLNVTITANSNGASGAGWSRRGSQTHTHRNVILAGNTGTSQCRSTPTSLGNNLCGDATCNYVQASDRSNTNPMLGALANNGGPTDTHALLAGSVAIDGGSAAGPASDQRGVPRPFDGDGNGSSLHDIGAYEASGGYSISGTVYHDIDADGSFDPGELGIGDAWVKLINAGTVVGVVPAHQDSGGFTFAGVLPGNYSLIVDNNALVGDVVPNPPGQWLFQNPPTGSRAIVVGASNLAGQNFGLIYNFNLSTDCTCGYQDGLYTQAAITVDGIMTDWPPVFVDGDNVACDAADGTDRDSPVQSAGRNLVRVAATYTASHLSIFTQRTGSSSNTQNFLYYADTNSDGLMLTGELVIVADWKGNSGDVTLMHYTYNAAAPGGDRLIDADGYADGYPMPGTLTFVANFPAGSGAGSVAGSGAGVHMEWSLPWASFGVPPGSAVSWHVSATNASPGSASLPAQIDDNLGGCGGQCAGSNQFGGIATLPVGVTPGDTTYLAYKLVNTGNGADRFDVEVTSSGAWAPVSVSLYRDLGTRGAFDGADVPLTDTDADLIADTGMIPAGDSIFILVAVVVPGPPALGAADFTTTASSNFLPGCGSTLTPAAGTVTTELEILGIDLVVAKTDGRTSVPPGRLLTYTITVRNAGPIDLVDGAFTDTLDAGIVDVAAATWTALVTGPGSVTPASGTGHPAAVVDLDSSSVATFTVSVPVRWTATGSLINRAFARAFNETEIDSASNVAADTTLLDTQALDGRVLEDPDGDGAIGDAIARPGVVVRCFADDGDGVPDAGDVFVRADTTEATGDFSLTVPDSATLWVSVASRTVASAAPFRAGAGPDSVWLEQTWAPAGGWIDDGAGGTTERAVPGSGHGGRRRAVSDDANALSTSEHIARIPVLGANVGGIEFGFSARAIVTTRDGDDDPGSARSIQGAFRQFVQNANALSGAERTAFRLSTADAGYAAPVWRIALTAGVPALTEGAELDATTQPGYAGSPLVVLDGAGAGAGVHGVRLAASGATVRGFGIERFAGSGIRIESGSGSTIAGNSIGTDVGGVLDRGNGAHGVEIVAASANAVGGVAVADGNRIAFNGGSGVAVLSASDGNTIVGNAIFDNDSLGIDLSASLAAADGVSPNDPGDVDGGGNAIQNFPDLAGAVVAGGSTTVQGAFGGAAGAPLTLHFYSGPTADPSGFGEGAVYRGAWPIATDGAGLASFTAVLPVVIPSGHYVTATAASAAGATSEFSAPVIVEPVEIVKRAYLLDGTPITDGATLPRGTAFRFMLYVNNPGVAVSDITLRDALDPVFQYVPGSLRLDASIASCPIGGCGPAEESAILAAAVGSGAVTEAVDGDPASYAAGVVEAGDANVANARLDAPAGRVVALVFTVRLQ